MNPIKFKGYNREYAKNQDEYMTLPAFVDPNDTTDIKVVSCWQLSWKERLKLLFTGKIWLSLWTFGTPLTPSYLTVHRKELIWYKEDGEHK